MAINRTPKRVAKAQQPQYNDIYKALESGESEVTLKSEGPDVTGQLADLIKRVDQLSNDNAALRQQQLHTQHQPPQQQVYVAAQQPQQEQMPDPVIDPQGHGKWLEKRIENLTKAGIEAYKKQQEAATNSSSSYDTLWNDFTTIDGNEAWADKPEMVQVASLKVAKKAAAKGLDPEKYMLQNSDMFFKELRETLETDFGKPEEDDDENEEAMPEGDEIDRTAGLMGGQPAPVNKVKSGTSGNPDMLGDLTAIQRKGGWY